MMLPLFCLYIWRSAARVVRNAPSRWIASSCLPLGEFEVDQRCDDLDAGIADQNVERAEGRDHLGGADVDLLLVGDVHGDADDTLAARINLAGGGIGRRLIEVGDGDLGAFAGIKRWRFPCRYHSPHR